MALPIISAGIHLIEGVEKQIGQDVLGDPGRRFGILQLSSNATIFFTSVQMIREVESHLEQLRENLASTLKDDAIRADAIKALSSV